MGTPGFSDAVPWDGSPPLLRAGEGMSFMVTRPATADNARYVAEVSDDLLHWRPASVPVARSRSPDGQEIWVYTLSPAPGGIRGYARVRVESR